MTQPEQHESEQPSKEKLNEQELEKAQGGYTATKERPPGGGGQQPVNP